MKAAITKAIGVHGAWKTRLRSAIAARHIEIPPAVIARENMCDFGKWLHSGELDNATRQSEIYRRVRTLHADFHRVASEVAQLALDGKTEEAEESMALNGAFALASAKLTGAMLEWQRTAT